jgi:hypothetical protein
LQAVNDFDAEALPLERLMNLLSCIPSPDEVNKISAFVKTHAAKLPATVPVMKLKAFAAVGEEDDGPGRESLLKVAEVRPKTEQEILNELKLGKPEQYVYIMSKVLLLSVNLSFFP